jgi:uncharacterized protein (DUF1800 family)
MNVGRVYHHEESDMGPTALPPLTKVDPVQAWQRWEPTAEDPFDVKWAGHLYRRATFGGTLAEMREAVKQGPGAMIERLIKGDTRYDQLLRTEGERIARKNNNAFETRSWWVYCILYSGYPLREKMTLFWHNHFATSITKVKSTQLMLRQNELLRKHALGKFQPFLLEMSKDPAMLIWLDSNSNVKAHPNENYAREIMELFSLGVGNYTEKDIREAARAFTGWHTDGEQYEFNPGFHDTGEKTVLKQAGNWDGGDIVRILIEQPCCARFLVRKLYRNFVSENQDPPDAFLEPLCEQLRKSDYDIAGVLRTMLGSRHFFSGYAFRQRIKNPVELAVGAARSVANGQIPPSALVNRLEAMGQELFAPPNVKGWTGAQAWLNTSTILTRQNFAQTVAMGTIWNNAPTRGPGRFEAVEDVVDLDEPPVASDPATPGVAPKRPSRPEEPPPPKEFDPARVVHEEKVTKAEEIVRVLLDTHLPGGVSKTAHAKLVTFVEAGNPKDKALDRRVREAVHAIMCMPEYQLA